MSEPFDTPPPVEYETTPPLEDMLDHIAQVVTQLSILNYRIYDLLALVAMEQNETRARRILTAHEQGKLISPPAWIDESQLKS